MEAQIRSGAGRDLPFTFFVSEASVVIEGRRSEWDSKAFSGAER